MHYLLQPFRRKQSLIKSNQSIYDFKKYDPGVTNDKIYWGQYKIGDCVIYRGKTNRAWVSKGLYIRSYCTQCTESLNDKLTEDYFKYPNNYKCKSCRHHERYPSGGVLADTGYKVCINCFERFKYKNNDKLCDECLDVNILDYFNFLIENKKYLSCNDCKNILPKLCQHHFEQKLLIKYDDLFKSCKFCIKWTPQNCKTHKYYFINN